MKLKHWGQELRSLFAFVVCLPLAAFGVVSWFAFSIISDFFEVTKKVISNLPADKGIEVANILAQVQDRSEFTVIAIPAICGLILAIVHSVSLAIFFGRLTSRGYQVSSAQKEIHQLTDRFTQNAEKIELISQQSTTSIEHSVVHLEMISNLFHKMAVGVEEADKNARVAVSESERSETDLNHVIDSLGHLVKQSRKLEEITNVIESIAFQTNILAVNAAVEAARAGEQGRGFAIVAEAVRNLAQTSASSAKNISALIRESGETSKRAIESIRSGTAGLSSTLNQIRRSQNMISNVVGVSVELNESIAKMSQSLHNLESTSQFAGSAVEDARQIQFEFSKSANEFRDASAALSKCLLSDGNAQKDALQMNTTEKNSGTVSDSSHTSTSTHDRPTQFHGFTERAEHARTATERATASNGLGTRKTSFAPQSKSTKQAAGIEKDGVKAQRAKESHGAANSLQQKNNVSRSNPKVRAKDLIPFEGETETEMHGDSKIGNIAGF